MKKEKKNNKGFSLVELIVVVLIMAIIAVALAPQVMKWVNNSRIATDRQTADSVVSYAQLALTDKDAYTAVTGASTGYTIVLSNTSTTKGYAISKDGTAVTASADDKFVEAFCSAAGIADAPSSTTLLTLKTTDAVVTVTVTKAGVVSWAETSSSKLTSDDLD